MLRRKTSTSLSLPTKQNQPPTELDNQCAMIFGRKSWGKTTLLSQYPNSLVMLLEPGRRNLRIIQIPEPGVEHSWENILEYIDLFIDSDLSVLGIDTVDRFYDICLKAVCMMEAGVDHPQKAGKDSRPALWDLAKNEFEKSLEKIKAAGKTWILTSHDKKVMDRHPIDGTETEMIFPTCKPAAWKIAQSMCDYVFHVNFYQRQRVITVRDLANVSIASCGRSDVFTDPDGALLSRFALPADAEKAFDTLLAAYNNKLRDVDWEPPKKKLAIKSNGAPKKKLVLTRKS